MSAADWQRTDRILPHGALAAGFFTMVLLLCTNIWIFIHNAGKIASHVSHDVRRDCFAKLQDLIGLTPGNLITHLRKLEDAGYITTHKNGSGVTARTAVALTTGGRAALDRYSAALRELLDSASQDFPADANGAGQAGPALRASPGGSQGRSRSQRT